VANLLVISGEQATREALRSWLAEERHLVTLCDGLSAVPRLLALLTPDLLCLDVRDDHASVTDFWAWFLADEGRSSIPILFVLPPGARCVDEATPSQFRQGCDGFVARPLDGHELRQKVAALLSAGSSASFRSPVLRSPPFLLDASTHFLSAKGGTAALTPTEHQLFAYFMERRGAVVSSDELLEGVWGFDPATATPAVVRVHVSNLRRKMAPLRCAHLLQTLPHRGYRLMRERVDVLDGEGTGCEGV